MKLSGNNTNIVWVLSLACDNFLRGIKIKGCRKEKITDPQPASLSKTKLQKEFLQDLNYAGWACVNNRALCPSCSKKSK